MASGIKTWHLASFAALLALAWVGCFSAGADAAEPPANEAQVASAKIDGKEIFMREWIAGDPRSHGGDGLGPVFNDTSCVSCHNQAGTGGAGPAGKNAEIITPFAQQVHEHVHHESVFSLMFGSLFGRRPQPLVQSDETADSAEDRKKLAEEAKRTKAREQRERLAKLHPGFRTARSVVLHRFGTDADYAAWRSKMNGLAQFGHFAGNQQQDPFAKEARRVRLPSEGRAAMKRLVSEAQLGGAASSIFGFGPGQVGNFFMVRSQRNPIALFGDGLLDSIPDDVLRQAAKRKYEDYPEITGRLAKNKDGKIGRFGWKAQTASLEDFVLTACAVELGLHVPGHPQAGVPKSPTYEPPGLDLNKDECNALISYVSDLPRPKQIKPAGAKIADFVNGGKQHFVSVGCAACHTPDLGEATGVYSDLLLHDMGPSLGDTGNYGTFVPNSSEENNLDEPIPPFVHGNQPIERLSPEQEAKVVGAMRLEWRTPPLWGVRDSAPYLHDGRARTLEQAIAFHGGEASASTRKYFALKPAERQQLIGFLKSLAAPQ